MGKAIILQDSDFSNFGLGTVTRLDKAIVPLVSRISQATVFSVVEDETTLTGVSWSISDNTLASLQTNQDGTCTVTPLSDSNTNPVVLSATVSGETLSIEFVPKLATMVLTWYIDRCSTDVAIANANLANGGWAYSDVDNSLLQGKTINRIKLVPFQAGVMNIYKASAKNGTTTQVGTFTILSEDIGNVTTYEITDFTLGESEWFVLGEANSAGGFKYQNKTSGMNGFYTKIPWSPTPSNPPTPGSSTSDLNLSVGYYGPDDN